MFTSRQERYSFFLHSTLFRFFLAAIMLTIIFSFALLSGAGKTNADENSELTNEAKLQIIDSLSDESLRVPSAEERRRILETLSGDFSANRDDNSEEDDSSSDYTAPEGRSLFGWAWSDNFGWISFNCKDTSSCATSEYRVAINEENGILEGFAWSDNLGWISFNESDLDGCPAGQCNAKLLEDKLAGWARACSVFEHGCSGAPAIDDERGGWDGWISLSGPEYGVILNGSDFEGFAWDASDVEGQLIGSGWIDFNPAFGGVTLKEPNEEPGDDNGNGGGGGGGGGAPAPAPLAGGGGGGGGTTIRLEISNEKVEQIATGTALVTWTSNLQAKGQVFYDVSSHATSSLPFTEYASATGLTSAFVTEHSAAISNLEHGIKYYFRPAVFRADREVGGKELSITLGGEFEEKKAPVISAVCEEYLLDFIKFGEKNNPIEVIKLQTFLRNFEDFTDVPVNGVYDQKTFDAVSAFQERYSDEILSPWGIDGSTGYVYITTRKKINEIYCQTEFPLTGEQKKEIENYKTLLEKIYKGAPDSGIEVPVVGVIEKGGGISEIKIAQATDTSDIARAIEKKESAFAKAVSAAVIFAGGETLPMILLLIVAGLLGFVLYDLLRRRKEKKES